MESTATLLPLAALLVAAKCAGAVSARCGMPSVVGQILVGVLLGPSIFGLFRADTLLSSVASVGVILLMFIAGVETDLVQMRQVGTTALLVACGGVLVPMGGGIALMRAWAYLGALLLERAAVTESEEAFARALACGPEEFLIRLKRGEAMLRLGRTFDALDELTHAVMLDAPDKPTAVYARNLLNATRAQAARSAPRLVGTHPQPRRLVRWMSANQRETEVAA
jgi:Sodium/hydrogen exchanger family